MSDPPIDIGIAEDDRLGRRGRRPPVEHAHDEVTADLLTQRLQVHEKTAWMPRSLLA